MTEQKEFTTVAELRAWLRTFDDEMRVTNIYGENLRVTVGKDSLFFDALLFG
jgi:hypothetical protein